MANFMLSESFVKQLHLLLKSGTSDSRKSWFAVGDYKRFENEITLPLHTKLTDEEVGYVIEQFSRIVKEYI